TGVIGQDLQKAETDISKANWKDISSFFVPPTSFQGKFGKYRSPLNFYDGRQVKTQEDWKERRTEILYRWTELMGKWPPFIKNQTMEVLETTPRDGYTQLRVRFSWLPNETTDGYLLLPDGGGKKPAVITVFYEPESAIGNGRSTPDLDFAFQLVKRGFITLSIGTTEATEAKTYSLYYPSLEKATVQPLSMLAYAAANSWYLLSNLPQVDSTRIGIMGLSFGGKWAMFASCLFDKFACAVWSDPGIVFDESRESVNYWEPWYLGYTPKPWRKRGEITKDNPAKGLYPKLVSQGYDLHELHALMAPRPFLVSGGSEDPPERWVPLNHAIAVNGLLGYENRVAMTNRPTHLPDSQSNEQAYSFLEYFLKNESK
ncbi:MAG: acyl-CoA thioester hydrolase/BAAT C-terminal domain-containing protein, partial [Daejeonella sp.]|uniref:acyl-CoA thioester hydrolase/BAAT C-terminal domain-containing protein n=1 Tax=Daejeonella sp. TaxID=2805397 RepID=UPI003C74361D